MRTTAKRMVCVLAGLLVLASVVQADEAVSTGAIKGKAVDGGTGTGLSGVNVALEGATKATTTGATGAFSFTGLNPGSYVVVCSRPGYQTRKSTVSVSAGKTVDVTCRMVAVPKPDEAAQPKAEPIAAAAEEAPRKMEKESRSGKKSKMMIMGGAAPGMPARSRPAPGPMPPAPRRGDGAPVEHNTEAYDSVSENIFVSAVTEPVSTFSIDVDTASYANMRRFLNQNQLPPKDAVRIEEMVNYFHYTYPDPKGKHPFSITTEISSAPWNAKHRVLMIGLQGKKVDTSKMPPNNLVFLLDVSGSMNSPNKLPLLQKSFKLLVENMRSQDRVAIVVYAGAAGLVLPSTPGKEADKILAALDKLQAGGSTAGGAGIKLAYKVAKDNFIENGNNRIILATDGDFNIGASSDGEMVRLIEEKRKEGVFLTVLGLGRGNYKDAKMEKLADKGNGNYAYIDTIMEAKKVLVTEMGSTLLTIAKDVKIQIEFNPARVKGYRLIGYENRMLKNEDFNDDTKDAGEMGAGHSVTAFYEIIPADSDEALPGVDALKYQDAKISDAAKKSPELATVKFRYKAPKEDTSQLIVEPILDKGIHWKETSGDFRFASAVVELGLLLRGSEFKGSATFESLIARAKNAAGKDPHGYRAEFVRLAEMAQALAKK
ncbi:MAG: von Willebrand factor type A domain-containing protein [Pseudomonadota bacterium]